jgi:hypothetical protein
MTVTESARDSWLPMPSWARKGLMWAGGLLVPLGVAGLIAWGALSARAEEDAARLERQADRIAKVAADALSYRDMTAARVGSLEARQAEQAAKHEALQRQVDDGLDDIKQSLRRLEDRFGTRRGD